MNAKSILESIELDVRQLKCLLESFEKEPDDVLRAVLLRDIAQAMEHLQQLHTYIDDYDIDRIPSTVDITGAKPETVTDCDEWNVASMVTEDEELPPCVPIDSVEPLITSVPNFAYPPAVHGKEPVFIPLSLNDTFLFSRILFDGDMEALKEFWVGFSTCYTHAQALQYIESSFWDASEETMPELYSFIEQFYANK